MLKTVLFYYCLILATLITLGAASDIKTAFLPFLFFLPVTLYFLAVLLLRLNFSTSLKLPHRNLLWSLLLYYSFIVVTVMSVVGLAGAKTVSQLVSAVIFLPTVLFFCLRVLPKKTKALDIPVIVLKPKELMSHKRVKLTPHFEKRPKIDLDRRQFLKLIGSAGLALFLFSIFAKKAEAAFFGSVPGPGTVAIKDSGGTLIDPAIKTPTDGYKITQMDETSDSPNTYYAYVNKDGAWFIMKDDGSGNYRYTKNTSDFTNATTGWPNRASLTYDYFDAIF